MGAASREVAGGMPNYCAGARGWWKWRGSVGNLHPYVVDVYVAIN